MIYFMYYYHRFEYNEHKKRMIKLYVFTMISLIATLGSQSINVFTLACLPLEEPV